MRFLTWLFERAPTEADPPPQITMTVAIGDTIDSGPFVPDIAALERSDATEPQPPAPAKPLRWPHSVTTPEAAIKPREPTVVLDDPDSASDLGDAFCLLEYCDASGEESSRRVSMRSLKESAGHIYLNAFCFERRALRQFRLDRITAMITEEGELLDPADYFALHGIALRQQTPAEAIVSRDAGLALTEMRAGIVMLTAVARADRSVDIREVDAVQTYAERELVALGRDGILAVTPTMEVVEAMAREIAMMRPLAQTLKAQALRICDWPDARFARLRRAMQDVITADGRVLPSEINAVADLDRLLRESPQERRSEVTFSISEAEVWDRTGWGQ